LLHSKKTRLLEVIMGHEEEMVTEDGGNFEKIEKDRAKQLTTKCNSYEALSKENIKRIKRF
jgi:hypothetical protein